ncbi:DUF3866 family protein [Candidatus Formimonas warabiya]|nr:DUF3866 family protein [Candidatus Formimonas warabiya]
MAGKVEATVGKVTEIMTQREGFTEIEVQVDEKVEKAVNYDDITGKISKGDRVVLNTTAVRLGLGTGGYHFVQANLTHPVVHMEGPGHIMKLRYTPEQIKVLSIEEEAAGFSEVFNRFQSLDGFPVVIFSLHSALAPIVVSIKLLRPKLKIAYIMTDGGALPVRISHSVYELRNSGLLDMVITSGHTFGGDFETINIYSALITAKEIAGADAAVIGMGPGNVGTGTKWGFSGIQLGESINAVNILGGRPVFCPRISFCDPRARHRGISHHSQTVLSTVALTPAIVVLPYLAEPKNDFLKKQIENNEIEKKHRVIWEHGDRGWEKLQEMSLRVTTMGRGIQEEKDFFLGACASGLYLAKLSRQIGLN